MGDFEKSHRQTAESQGNAKQGKMSVGEAIKILRSRIAGDANLKPRSRSYYEQRIVALLSSWPGLEQKDVRSITRLSWSRGASVRRPGKPYVPCVAYPSWSVLVHSNRSAVGGNRSSQPRLMAVGAAFGLKHRWSERNFNSPFKQAIPMASTHSPRIRRLSELWSFDAAEILFSFFAVDDGIVYVLGRSKLQLLDAKTGDPRNERAMDWPLLLGHPAFSARDMFIPHYQKGVFRLSKSLAGEPECVWSGGNGICNVLVEGDSLYCTSWDDQREDLAAYLHTPCSTRKWGITTHGGIGCRATVVNGRVFVGFTNGGVAAYNEATQAKEWTCTDPKRVSNAGRCVVEDGRVFLAGEQPTRGSPEHNRVYCVDEKEGNTKWSSQVHTHPRTPVTLFAHRAYCGTTNAVYGFDQATGQAIAPACPVPPIAYHPLQRGGDRLPDIAFLSEITAWNHRLHVAAGTWIIVIDPDSLQEVQRYSIPGGNVWYFTIQDSTLYVATGTEDWALRLTAYAL